MPLDLERSLDERGRLIEGRLGGYLNAEQGVPPRLLEAMRYSLLAPGKRLRPILVLMASSACGGDMDEALPAACAVEMVHSYSLVHDDLPAMDDDDVRRGRPSCHKQFDEATAILVGDALLTLAFQVLAREIEPGDLSAACVWELARAAGAAGMVGGQADDLAWEQRQGGTLTDLDDLHQRKTGALFRAALRIGGLIALRGSSGERAEAALAALDGYGEKLGLAFQISDDLLDVEGNSDQTGKRVGKDARRGKLTYPTLMGVEAARNRLAAVCQEGVNCLNWFGEAAVPLAELIEFVRKRNR